MSNANANKPGNPYAKKAESPIANPYAKKTSVVNPYARKPASNPYAKSAGTNPYAKSAAPSGTANETAPSSSDQNNLWVDKHAPQATRDILGNKDNIQKLSNCELFVQRLNVLAAAMNFSFLTFPSIDRMKQGLPNGRKPFLTLRTLAGLSRTRKVPGRLRCYQGLLASEVRMGGFNTKFVCL